MILISLNDVMLIKNTKPTQHLEKSQLILLATLTLVLPTNTNTKNNSVNRKSFSVLYTQIC
jgi:hypothetical protein